MYQACFWCYILNTHVSICVIQIRVVLTGDAFVGVILFLISAVFLDCVLWDGLHLHTRSVGQHTQVLKQTLPGNQSIV